MSIHGWNSNRDWQLLLTTSINSINLTSIPYTYGRKILKIFPWHIKHDVSKFKEWYFNAVNSRSYDIDITKPYHRPSIIAHSLGSYILVKALGKYPEIKFDKIFLVGSIVPENFDWFKLILNDQVGSIVYERAPRDWVVSLSFLITGSTRTCTKYGFLQKSSFILETNVEHFGHGDFNYEEHFITMFKKHIYDKPHQLSILHGKDLSEEQIRQKFDQSVLIDNQVYDDAVYQSSPVTINQGLTWFRTEPDIWMFVEDNFTKEVLGYINAVPVNDKTYEAFKNGTLQETEITPDNILSYDTATEYNLLILSIAVKKTPNGQTSSSKILEFLMMSFLYKHLRDQKIKKFAAVGWTRPGENLCLGFGMQPINKDENEHPIFECDTKQKKSKHEISAMNFMARWFFTNMRP